ncbi:AAA family ATPase [Corynebacterium pseudodiphtheriticum]|uniref:AAA family ATPase n=1 Tax=Corynebacterium pseudodiphtheriticum TaxID=37637 RepID=UPI00255001ED|nr:AAA family ATPase [Corynebacterium pseudodiphtheriticum]MDK8478904.1 AAA family ATPase [Corynebacterium pseudodiphtheriticum]
MLTAEKQKQAPVYVDETTGELTDAGVASLAKHRLGLKTLAELADEPDDPARHFLIPGLVSSSLTYLYGQSKVGKSFVVANVVASLLDDKPFFGRQPLKTVDGVVIFTTDPGDDYAYDDRLDDLGVAPDDRVLLVPVGINPKPERLAQVADLFVNGDYGFAVFDNATGLIPADQNINAREPWISLRRFLGSLGVPVLLVGHSICDTLAKKFAPTVIQVIKSEGESFANPSRIVEIHNNIGEPRSRHPYILPFED